MSLLEELQALLQEKTAREQLRSISKHHYTSVSSLVETAQRILSARLKSRPELNNWCNTKVQGVCKDAAEAGTFKALGSKDFGLKNYLQAAEDYGKALQEAPFRNLAEKQFASRLLSNRALCLLKAQSGPPIKISPAVDF